MFEAKAKLSELCARVARRGEVIVITRRGRAIARLTPIAAEDGAATVWERRERFVRKQGAIREDLPLPRRRKEPVRDPLA